MKRISVLAICVILGLSLAGCGNTETAGEEPEPVTESVTETAEIQENAQEETTVKEKVSETEETETKKAEGTTTTTTKKAEETTKAQTTTKKQTTAKSASKSGTTKAPATKKSSSSTSTTSKAKSTTSKSTTKAATTKAATTKAAATKKKGLTYDEVLWVQKKTNEYIVSKGIQYSEEVGSWSGYESSSGSGITSKEILLEREKDWVDSEYEDCIRSGYKTVSMYCRVEKQSSGSYYLYIVYG